MQFESCGTGLPNHGFVKQQHGLSGWGRVKQQPTGCSDFAHLQSPPGGIRIKHRIVGCQHNWYIRIGLHLYGGTTSPPSHLAKQLHNAGGPCRLGGGGVQAPGKWQCP